MPSPTFPATAQAVDPDLAATILSADSDPGALDAAYSARAAVPDHPAIFRRWAAESAAVRDRWPWRLGLSYGSGPRQAIDLVLPPGAPASGPVPCVLFLHGGYWQAMDRSDFHFLAEGPLSRGLAFALAGYDLCPGVTLSEIADQTGAALRHLAAEGAGWGIDPGRLVLAGHSAGGHLVAHLLSSAEAPPVAGGLAISGLFALDPLCGSGINKALGLSRADAARLSPLFRPPRPGTRLATAVGGLESPAFHAQSALLATAWGRAGADCETVPLPECHHFTAVERLGDPAGPLMHILAQWLGA